MYTTKGDTKNQTACLSAQNYCNGDATPEAYQAQKDNGLINKDFYKYKNAFSSQSFFFIKNAGWKSGETATGITPADSKQPTIIKEYINKAPHKFSSVAKPPSHPMTDTTLILSLPFSQHKETAPSKSYDSCLPVWKDWYTFLKTGFIRISVV